MHRKGLSACAPPASASGLFAGRGYLNDGDGVAAGVLIFVAASAVGIQVIFRFLVP